MKEYVIDSRLGRWPEVFYTAEEIAEDLAFNKDRYPDVEFHVLERDVTSWVLSDVEVPVVEYIDPPDLVALRKAREENEADDVTLGDLSAWLEGKDV